MRARISARARARVRARGRPAVIRMGMPGDSPSGHTTAMYCPSTSTRKAFQGRGIRVG